MAPKKPNKIGLVVLCILSVWIVSICFPLNQAGSEPLDGKGILKSSDQLIKNPPKLPPVKGQPTMDKGTMPTMPKVKPDTGAVPTLPKGKLNTKAVPPLPNKKNPGQLELKQPKLPSVKGQPTMDKGTMPTLPKVKPDTGTIPTLPKGKLNTKAVPPLPDKKNPGQLELKQPKLPSVKGQPTMGKGTMPTMPKVKPDTGAIPTLPNK
jgi:hypothetical protein